MLYVRVLWQFVHVCLLPHFQTVVKKWYCWYRLQVSISWGFYLSQLLGSSFPMKQSFW